MCVLHDLHLIERLLPIMPHPSLGSFFVNSDSEAIEVALKMVRSVRAPHVLQVLYASTTPHHKCLCLCLRLDNTIVFVIVPLCYAYLHCPPGFYQYL